MTVMSKVIMFLMFISLLFVPLFSHQFCILSHCFCILFVFFDQNGIFTKINIFSFSLYNITLLR